MKNYKTFSLITGTIFALIAILHALRILYNWQAVIAGWTVPLWVSVVAILISSYLAYQGLSFGKRR